MTFDLQSKMEVIEACFILVTFALFFSNAPNFCKDRRPIKN